MERFPDLIALARQSLMDPIAGGRALIALNPVMAVRWMLLTASVIGSVVILYAPAALLGATQTMPSPFVFALWQMVANLVAVVLITWVGRGFGGTGGFADALLLMGWLQALTMPLLIVQLLVLVAIPALNLLVVTAAVAVSMWLLTGFICALHGFRSRLLVLVGGLMVVVIASFVLSLVLLLLGVEPTGVTNA